MSKILFLDLDGVIFTVRAGMAYNRIRWSLDPIAALLVKRLCIEHDLTIVISSTMRKINDQGEMQRMLLEPADLGQFFHDGGEKSWKTPTWRQQSTMLRGVEIDEWMQTYGIPDTYIILDDDTDMLPTQLDQFIQCESNRGMGLEEFIKCEEILNASSTM